MRLVVVLLSGCATGPNGERLGPWQILQKWDASMNATEARLADKSYNH